MTVGNTRITHIMALTDITGGMDNHNLIRGQQNRSEGKAKEGGKEEGRKNEGNRQYEIGPTHCGPSTMWVFESFNCDFYTPIY